MRMQELEFLILQTAERIENGTHSEDQAIELKSVFPTDDTKAARQLAGLANASRSDGVVWIIGMDEDRGVIGTDKVEISNWWNSVRSKFSSVCPDLEIIAIKTLEKGTVLGLYFSTAQAPYLVNNPDGGRITQEVPWREGNSTRTANRNDLLKVLVPRVRIPQVDILNMTVTVTNNQRIKELAVHSELYIYSSPHHIITIPYHKAKVLLSNDIIGTVEIPMKYDMGNIKSINLFTENSMITQTRNEAILSGSGLFTVMAKLENRNFNIKDFNKSPIEITMDLYCHEIEATLHVKLSIEIPVIRNTNQVQWVFKA